MPGTKSQQCYAARSFSLGDLRRRCAPALLLTFSLSYVAAPAAQPVTDGYLNVARSEAPGTLLSHPDDNDSAAIGRTTTLNYLNGWVIVGGERPGSASGSDLELRVYDIANPANPVRRTPDE